MVDILNAYDRGKAGILSFDVFDTLIKRIVPPEQLYMCIENTLKLEENPYGMDFAKRRMAAENYIKDKKNNYSLRDIYSTEFFSKLGNIEYLIGLEKEYEINNSIPNAKAKKIYDSVVGKMPIICVSDMYLDSDTINLMLKRNGYDKIDRLYVSCEYNASKKHGDIWNIVCREQCIKKNKIIHIGDAVRSDYIIPISKGIKANHMRRTDSLKPTDSYYYNLGYDTYGEVIYEFCKWIHKRKRNEKLLFLAREGELLERCYRIIYPEEKTGILYASREVVTKGVAYTILEHESFEKFLEDVSVWRNETVVALLNRLGLNKDEVIRKIRDDGINLNDTINKNVIFYLNKNKTYFMDILVRYAAPFDKYIESVLEEENLVIDVGWTGSMQTLIAKYLKLKKSNKSVYGLYLGINNKINRDGFLFDNKNKLFHQVMNFSGLIEILFMPNHGTTIGYKTNGNQVEPIMAKSEFSDVSMQHITSFQTGVCSFVEKASNIGASFETNKCINKMVDLGCNPCKKDIYMMGNIEFFDNGNTYRLVEKDNIFHFKSFISKFIDCRWKTAFLKRNLHINLPYSDMVIVMRKISDRQISKKQR